MRHFCGHADALSQRGVRVNRFAYVHRVSAHLYRQCNLTNHVAGVCTNDAAAQNLAVAMRGFAVVKQQFGKAFVAAIGDGAS